MSSGFKHSVFFFGHIVTANNCYINFTEGGAEITARLSIGSYALTDYITEVARAMTEAGSQAYDCIVDRATRLIAITALDPFQLLLASGSNYGAAITEMAGFEAIDTPLALEHIGTYPSGKAYLPQAPINGYTPFKHWKGASDASVNVSASGRATIISFGNLERMKCNIHAVTDKDMGTTSPIENNPNAINECLEFLEYVTQKNPIEFMFDREAPEEFDKCILEQTKDSKDGVSFELYEGLGRGLMGIYETDSLTFRKME